MTEFRIWPLKGVDSIEFGMARDDVRSRFGSEPKSFKRSSRDTFPCDYFASDGVFFYYDDDGHLEAVEFALPAQPSVENLKLLGLGLDVAMAALSGLDSEVKKESDGAIAYQLGVSIWAPLAKDDVAAPVETVLAFRPGYYN
jgi:hypothetical protein